MTKKCPKCKTKYSGDIEYCICGGKLSESNNFKDILEDLLNSIFKRPKEGKDNE